jgi:hypothetical protein
MVESLLLSEHHPYRTSNAGDAALEGSPENGSLHGSDLGNPAVQEPVTPIPTVDPSQIVMDPLLSTSQFGCRVGRKCCLPSHALSNGLLSVL